MKICGLNKTTLLDYPGKVAATIFLGGCNFRCPFCQNGALVLHPETEPALSQDEIFSFLKKRRNLLDGVCITGGEPTLAPNLKEFLAEIKSLHYLIKLDTNGSHPAVVKALAAEGLLDMVAMDIKTCPSRYPLVSGIPNVNMDSVRETAAFLLQGDLPYEFRTTVVRELHQEKDFLEIAEWISGAKAYYLQAYKESEDVLQPGFSSYTFEELYHFKELLSGSVAKVEIRGID